MSWARLDDRANEHRKQLAAGADACWLWCCGLMYANRQPARDGFIPALVLPMLYPYPPRLLAKCAERLVSVGLWVSVDGGYRIHQFGDWNRSREQVESERAATRNRVAKHRSNGVTPTVTNGVSNATVPDPLHLHLHSTPEAGELAREAPRPSGDPDLDSRLTSCPLNLAKTSEEVGIVRDFVQKYRVEPEQIHAAVLEFVSYWTIGGGMGKKHAGWPRKLREHLRKACERPGGLEPVGAIAHAPRQSRHRGSEARAEAVESANIPSHQMWKMPDYLKD